MNTTPTCAVLPCNGMDKAAGCVAREMALILVEQTGCEIICPVLCQVSDARYKRMLENRPLWVIDGCATRCASKLAAAKGFKVAKKLTVTDEVRAGAVALGASLRLDTDGLHLANRLVAVLRDGGGDATGDASVPLPFPEHIAYEIYQKDKFIFRLPKEGFLFCESDTWVYVRGRTARVGLTDFLQQSASDISFFNPPAVGTEVAQFGEVGTVETSKALVEVVSPVSGRVTVTNAALKNAPDLINDDPYGKGWLVEMELSKFDQDREMLLDFAGYLPIMKQKVDDFRVK